MAGSSEQPVPADVIGRDTGDEALTRIVAMFESEINRPTDVGNTMLRSQQGH